jgi:hypothetical protein
MGTQEEEAAALHRIQQEAVRREAERIMREDAARKTAEAANNQNKMVAEEPGGAVATGWPDNEVQPAQGRLTTVAGALGVGKAGNAAFAKQLLDAEQRPGTVASPDQAGIQTDGAKAKTSGVRAARPAFER